MNRQDFAYDLPSELIAQEPLAERSASRLLVLESSADPRPDRSAGLDVVLQDLTIRELPRLLRPGDLMVLNDTKVIAALLMGVKPSGGRVEVLLERAVGDQEALAQLRASKPIREGLEVATAGGIVRVGPREGDLWRIDVPGNVLEFFERWGEVPLPPYIRRPTVHADRERYQSVFARERGAVAAPTASLHFDPELLAAIQARGVELAYITLHVGAGTFQPVRTEDVEAHVMHSERAAVTAATCSAIEAARARGGRIVAIGTTVVRALESAALANAGSHEPTAEATSGQALPATGWCGETRLFIRQGFQFRVTDALLTNFHLPESTLLMLVCAFAGREAVLRAYRHAVEGRYRFFSYGDAMFANRRGADR